MAANMASSKTVLSTAQHDVACPHVALDVSRKESATAVAHLCDVLSSSRLL